MSRKLINPDDFIGTRVGQLEIVSAHKKVSGRWLMKVKCDCGTVKLVRLGNLVGDRPTQSCGCIKTTYIKSGKAFAYTY